MNDPLGRSGRSRCEQNKQRIFRVHLLGFALRADLGQFVVVPKVTSGNHGDCAAGTAYDDHCFDNAERFVCSFIGIGLQRNLATRRVGLHPR